MKYYLIAGEASGDLHGSNLIKQLFLNDKDAVIQCWGGDKMQAAGASLIKHFKDLAFMGFVEVIKNLPTILKNLRFCKEDILAFKPDVLILIDYPGFNLRIAKWAKENGFKVVYYISPQVWAWKENRVKQMKQTIDLMLCILPFEKDYYHTKWNWFVQYVGHPLIEVIDNFKTQNTPSNSTPLQKRTIALLPGSRKQEIQKKLPVMLAAAKAFTNYQFVVAKAPGLDDDFYASFWNSEQTNIETTRDTYALLNTVIAAIVTSGTATLETALFGVPEIVCYKGNVISYQIAKRLINIKYISLVNLIMDKQIVAELIQDEMNEKNITAHLNQLLNNTEKQKQLEQDYSALKEKLLAGGHASQNAAKAISAYLSASR